MEKRYLVLEKALCRELEILEEKYRNGQEMNEGDIRRADLLTHTLKSMAGYTAMKQAEGYGYDNSYAYGNRPPMNNNMNNNNMNNNMNNSYMNNMSNSYDNRSDMSRNNDMSGHYPPDYPMYPENRRW